ncbi:MAG TPA: LPS export ABC transporter periplasmic protein LptC [Desulfatirhabdiaceae bacterium]|nr:LPS export ABC transporter periplasmic protein LptC [Desulfatirhabdiaceae bacterium]
MMTRFRNHPGRIKLFLFVVIGVTIGVLAAIFIGYRMLRSDPQKLISTIQHKASLSIGKVHQVSTRDGIKEWSLDATSAHVVDETRKLMLEDITVVYFLKDGQEVQLKAEKGYLKTDSSDIEVERNVVVTFQDYRLESDILQYNHGRRLLASKKPVKIFGTSSTLTADSMFFDLDRNTITFQGNIEVIFREDIIM